ncbi:beta-1,3-glucanase family protein [Actinoplanes sp. NPDC049118]|uniref:beta-1,3-glucanase family protein n=1 Tax=Actinoplanes sp. NPDC049118 TaxID=3155769 RepID=UPI0033D8DA05
MRRKRTLLLSVAAVTAAAGTAWIALPASAAANTAAFTVTSDWGSGWQGEVTISNGGPAAMKSWKVEFDLPAGATIGSFWDAGMVADGGHRTFTNRPWNGAVPADGKVRFGLVGSGGTPVNCRLNGRPCGAGPTAPTSAAPLAAPAGTRPATPPRTAPATRATTTPPATARTTPPAGKQPVPPAGSLLPLTVTNRTGRSDAVHLYVLGVNLTTGKLGHVDSGGRFTAWTGGGAVPTRAPDVSIPGPANGAATTLKLPKNLSGRIYMSFGRKLDFRLANGGLVQPAPWSDSDPNRNTLFDWSEFTLDGSGLFLNSSQVDMFAVPHVVSVLGGDGVTSRTGELRAGGRKRVIEAIKAQPGYARTVQTRSDGTVLRVLAPGKAADGGRFSATYLDPFINSAWNAYKSKTLTVVPFGDRPNTRFFGRTSGNVMNFTDAAGRTVASFTKPSTANVWGCDGALGAPNDQVVGPIARTLCASMHRTTLGRLDTQPAGKAADFYRGGLTNHYSRIIHEQMADGKAYGFAFDDVQNQESLVHSGDPRRAGIVMTPF